MKTLTKILIVVFVSLFNSAFSQVDLGLKVGGNFSYVFVGIDNNIFVDNWKQDNNFKLAYHLGLYGDFSINKSLFIRSELLYSIKGYTTSPSVIRSNINLAYLTLSTLVGYNLNDKLAVLGGGELGYLLSAKSKSESNTVDIGDNYNEIDFGLSGGLRFKINKSFAIDLRYTHGFLSIWKFDSIQVADVNRNIVGNEDIKMSNQNLQLSLTYKLM